MVRTWLWRPYMPAPATPVDEKQYRCCCYLIPSASGFAVYSYVFAALQFGALLLLMLTLTQPGVVAVNGQTWANVIIWLGITLLGIVAARTQIPFYMQIYVILTTILYVVGFLCGSLLLVAALVLISVPQHRIDREMIDAINGAFSYRSHNLVGAIIMLIICLAVIVWQAQLTYSFYFYVRDRQLAIEEAERLRTAGGKAQLVDPNYPNKDLEKFEREPMLTPPPPYSM